MRKLLFSEVELNSRDQLQPDRSYSEVRLMSSREKPKHCSYQHVMMRSPDQLSDPQGSSVILRDPQGSCRFAHQDMVEKNQQSRSDLLQTKQELVLVTGRSLELDSRWMGFRIHIHVCRLSFDSRQIYSSTPRSNRQHCSGLQWLTHHGKHG